jgi:xylulokinase
MDMFMGLDIGTSGVKAILVDKKGEVKFSANCAHPLSTPKPGWAEQNPADWWAACVKAIRILLKNPAAKKVNVAAIGISGQMHSSVFLDDAGQVIRPALLWCDGRTSAECKWITKKVGEKNLKKWVSNPALEGFTLPKVLWLKNNEPAAFKKLKKIILAKDYIRYCLSGTLATEVSDASGTLMFDTAKLTWSRELMKSVGLSTNLLVDVGGSEQVLAKVSAEAAKLTGLKQGTLLVGGGADNACGAVGVGVVNPGEAVASWGTSGTVLAPTSKPVVDPSMRAHTFCHAVPNTWYVMGVMLTAGGAFSWHRENFCREFSARKDADLILNHEAAKLEPGAQGLTFLPYLQGERTPHRDATARGALIGLTLAHTRAHVTRSVMEGVCFGLKDGLEIIRAMKLPVKKMLLTGGGAKSPVLKQMQADIYGLAVNTVNREEGPAYGAALLAAVGAKAFKNVPSAVAATLKRSKPLDFSKVRHNLYLKAWQKFRFLYPVLKGNF